MFTQGHKSHQTGFVEQNFRGKYNGSRSLGSPVKAHDCAYKFSSTTSTQGIKAHLPGIQKSIGKAINKTGTYQPGPGSQPGIGSIKAALRDVTTKIENLMQSLNKQAGGKGTCSAAGQMNNMTQKLDELGSAQKPSKHEIIELLKQISQLLQKLENTIHTNAHSNMHFNRKS